MTPGAGARGARRKTVALDLGARRIGVAVSGAGGTLAFPRPVIERSGDPTADRRAIADLVEEEGAGVVVVGLPLSLDGGRGPAARAAEQEAAALSGLLEGRAAVETFDERFTTTSAETAMAAAGKRARDRRPTVDSAAATVLLQSWLDARRPGAR